MAAEGTGDLVGFGEQSPAWAPLLAAAWAARENAYAPYSGFRVGAAVLLASGATAAGCNVENASYPLCLCAERAALAQAVALHGARPGDVAAVAIVADAPRPVPPCGACRQALAEFAGAAGLPVLMANATDRRLAALGDLLPDAFVL
jgi:cytidine deaminase